MPSRISQSIKEKTNNPSLIPFVVAGFPNLETTKDLIFLFEKKGVACIELGIPFSDPLADGPVIQQAAKEAIENGTNINKIFDMLMQIKDDFSTPIVLFTYFNPVLNYGIENFVKRAKNCGVSGIIIPDLPIEESQEIDELCQKSEIDHIMLVAPTSDEERIERIIKASKGFIYLVSSTGVTGARESFSTLLSSLVSKIKAEVSTPLAVGFGISNKEHINQLKELSVDGAIIGSAFIKIIQQYKNDTHLLMKNISDYIDELYGV